MREIITTNGMTCLVDDKDFDRLSSYKWSAYKPRNVWYAKANTVKIRMHDMVLGTKPGFHIDHINGNGLDNQKANLRYCTNSQNHANVKKSRGESKFKGVTRRNRKSGVIYEAYITQNYSQKHLGSYKTEEEAALAYNLAATILFGEFALLNVIEP